MKSDLEQKFAEVKEEIVEKLKEAAKAMKQAANLAPEGYSLADLDYEIPYNRKGDFSDALYEVQSGIDAIGWRSSSLSC